MKRREFLRIQSLPTGGLFGMPTIIIIVQFCQRKPQRQDQHRPDRLWPDCQSHDLPETIKHDMCRVVAVADFDMQPRQARQKMDRRLLHQKEPASPTMSMSRFMQDYHEMLADKSIDAVIISTPDHWHAQPAMEAALAGKDIYMQKPTSLTIAEGRQMGDVDSNEPAASSRSAASSGQSTPGRSFKRVCELVRNGKIGKLKHIQVGLPATDPGCGEEPEMPVPANLNYDMWLGSTPRSIIRKTAFIRRKSFDRPGWLRCEQFGAGMITGWGAHHLDIAHWGMGTEFTGPVEIEGTGRISQIRPVGCARRF